MKVSARIRLHTYVRKDGKSQLYLLVIIDAAVEKIYLDEYWYPALFDPISGECRPAPQREREKKKQGQLEVADINLITANALAKATNIFTEARLKHEELSMKEFLGLYNSYLSRHDFITYFQNKLVERLNKGLIKAQTFRCQRATLQRLKEFRKELPFTKLKNFGEEFDQFLKVTRESGANTRWSRHKDVKTYLGLAIKDDIRFKHPYENYKVRKVAGKWKPCTREEFQQLHAYYLTCWPGSPHRQVLQRFLFACNTGLRISDQKRVRASQLWNRTLIFHPYKGQRFEKEALTMPLTDAAWEYAQDSIRENKLRTLFIGDTELSEVRSNTILKEVGQQLGIRSNLHHHVAREFFATEFLEQGGPLQLLQYYMDHEQITTTMKYVHLRPAQIQAGIHVLAGAYEKPLRLRVVPPEAQAS